MKPIVYRALASLALAALSAGAAATACSDFDPSECEFTDACRDRLPGHGTQSTGTGGGTPTSCIPSEVDGPIDDSCGEFVSSSKGHDGNAGIKIAPVQTISYAVDHWDDYAGPPRIYACAEDFTETVELPGGVTLYGGLDCEGDWRWIGDQKKTTVTGYHNLAALRIVPGLGPKVRVEDVIARGDDADEPGRSSIAVQVNGVAADLTRCELIAGAGRDGEPGATGNDGPGDIAMGGEAGEQGTDACQSAFANPGGEMRENVCEDGSQSTGGKGGNGQAIQGLNGDPGTPGTSGVAGTGQPEVGAWSCAMAGNGQDGADGVAGTPGVGAIGLGTLDDWKGHVGVTGGAGSRGLIGQGGGGGGGAKGVLTCAGGGGGSGGTGGCGGKPGQGGMHGGSSMALVSLDGTVTLTDCKLTAGWGGKGGAGGLGQPGGVGGGSGAGGGGDSMAGVNSACAGGVGGAGGAGGPGGGGLGGHSLAIAFRGTPVAKAGTVTLLPGSAGEGGPAGDGSPTNAGQGGVAAEEQEVP